MPSSLSVLHLLISPSELLLEEKSSNSDAIELTDDGLVPEYTSPTPIYHPMISKYANVTKKLDEFIPEILSINILLDGYPWQSPLPLVSLDLPGSTPICVRLSSHDDERRSLYSGLSYLSTFHPMIALHTPCSLALETTYLVFFNDSLAPIHHEWVMLSLHSSFAANSGWIYTVPIVPRFWNALCNSSGNVSCSSSIFLRVSSFNCWWLDPTQFTIHQYITPLLLRSNTSEKSMVSTPTDPVVTLIYRFCFSPGLSLVQVMLSPVTDLSVTHFSPACFGWSVPSFSKFMFFVVPAIPWFPCVDWQRQTSITLRMKLLCVFDSIISMPFSSDTVVHIHIGSHNPHPIFYFKPSEFRDLSFASLDLSGCWAIGTRPSSRRSPSALFLALAISAILNFCRR